ncbi:nucleotide exchange factor GrpE [Patescibacteria group bacterium]|nr:nucleotide exchange factor GrpE [Patescibacteria group bacterium]MBU2219994.1 nucleotide exchange factor GrpE [Patescibacteria group bacterium]MBU2264954.1 nucleotide exchange factor GrpE [Patescibacteria group bacterium]
MPEEKEQEIILDEENDESGVVEKVKKLKEQLKQCRQEKQDNLTGWQRAQADFINYRRRQEEQTSEWSKMFGEGLIKDLLPVLDTLDASQPQINADQEIAADKRGSQKAVEGLRMTREQLIKILAEHGLTEMKIVGEKFNPELHEAVEMVEAEKTSEGVVIEEVQKGYLLNGKILRVAKVKVTKN